MATVVDALVMTLGLDVREFKKGEKDVDEGLDKTRKKSDAVAKDMFEGGKKAGEFFSSIKTQLIGLLAVAVAGKGLTSFLQDSVSGMASLGRSAAYLGMSAKELDAWQAAAETVGGTAEATAVSFKTFAAGIEEFKATGQSPLVGLMRSLGVAITDENGKVKSYSEDFFELANKFKQMSGQDALFYGKRAGLDEGTINLLRQGGPAVKALVEQMEKLSGVTDDGVKSAQRNQAEWAIIRTHFHAIRETLSTELDPALEKIANRVLKWLDANHQLVATKIVEWIERFGNFVMRVGDWLIKADTATDGWSTKLLFAAAALRLLTGGGIIGGLARLATGLLSVKAAAFLAAAGVGALIGTGIYKLTEGTKIGDFFGKTATLAAAALGSKEAQDTLARDHFNSLPEHDQYTILKARQRAQAAKQDQVSSNIGDASPTRSKMFSSNGELFGSLEERFGLPSGVLARMFKQESANGTRLHSGAGANGPFQFMPDTAAQLGLQGNDVYNLDDAASAAAKYLAQLRKQFGGDMQKAVAAYNAGPRNVRKYGGIPPFAETQAYVRSVLPNIGAGSTALTRSPSVPTATQSTSETHIGRIEVNTQATDARGIVRDMREEISRNALVAQANNGLS